MKRIFQIAKYDFKRLMFNPITLVGLIIVLGVCFITGLLYKIPTSTLYSTNVNGQYTKAIYSNFTTDTGTTYDNKYTFDAIVDEAENYLDIQKDSSCFEFSDLAEILNYINDHAVVDELKKYQNNPSSSKYIAHNDISELQTLSANLRNYVTNFKTLHEFDTRLIYTKTQFEKLDKISTFLYNTTHSSSSIETTLNKLCIKLDYFAELQTYRNLKEITIDATILDEMEEKYITKTRTKLASITAEMQTLCPSSLPDYSTADVDNLKLLITNYKAVANSAKTAVLTELRILLKNAFGDRNLYIHSSYAMEDLKNNLVEAKFYINADNSYYVQYQKALNFGTASHKVTAFDHSYFIISIVGFLTILFGIFCAYKLFGRDRKSGKIDILLAQKVSFNQIFVGKFLAIIYCTSFVLLSFTVLSFAWGSLLYKFLPNSMFAIFNLQTAYTISPFLFLLLKILGIELQVIFWSTITIFLMNLSRRFELLFAIAVAVFLTTTILNIFLNNQIWYCLLPFIHVDLTSFIGGATMKTGFLVTSLYAYGNFFISLVYYLVVVVLVYNFTRQLFKKS